MATGSDGSVYTFTGDNLRATAQLAGTGPVLDWVWDQTSDVPTLLTDGAREYVYGPGGIALSDQPIVGTTGSHPVVFLHSDGFGSIRSATDTSGDQVWARSYDAYGADAGTWTAPGYSGPVSRLAWNGQYRDDDGNYYLRARVYDPAAGGFTSQDPALAASGEAYGYGNSSPTVFTDPMGTTAVSNGLTGLDDGSGNVAAVDAATTYDPAFAFRDGLPKCSGWSKSLKLGIGVAALIPFGGGILKGLKSAKNLIKCKKCVLPGLPGSAPKPLGLGSTGRNIPRNLQEQLAMTEVRSAPGGRRASRMMMGDPRWAGCDGWVKMEHRVNGVTIHYVLNERTGAVDDFKFVAQ